MGNTKTTVWILLGLVVLSVGVWLFLYRSPHKSTWEIIYADKRVTIALEKTDSVNSRLRAETYVHDQHILSSVWPLRYPVYHLECGDVNGDGIDDILVGVTKTTRFDPVKRKRLFLFKLFEGYIRPLWLGSRVSQPLEAFHFIPAATGNRIRTIEQEADGTYLVAEYEWKGFGLQFLQYKKRSVSLAAATQLLQN
jgi:hypothetical protein